MITSLLATAATQVNPDEVVTDFEQTLLLIMVFVIMFGLGAGLTPRDFKLALKRPQGLIIGFVTQFGIMPLLAFGLIMLFLFPLITMRTYAEEKRSGTIELLLTSPVTDVEIIIGKFLGAMLLYAAMLAVTLIHIGILFIFGNPEWKPIATGYLGLLLMGGCFLSLGLFISSLTKNQIVAAMATFAVFLMLWVINWISTFVGPTTQTVLQYLSLTEHFDDFAKGIIDTKHVIYYLSFMAFGLFLTAKSVDSERWRG